eukprot:TRINITY_DN3922_c0_g1_i1.p1 TRINITY_DN3922_c0_g1~~TRINITY_DN3922_c0_g1_i1.p1  ORF type:complete len:360 (-),score=111.09 TRINITY_DN3922_c0_g1_i1:47-1126(-)
MVSPAVVVGILAVVVGVLLVVPLPGALPESLPAPPSPESVLGGKSFKVDYSNAAVTRKTFYIDSHGDKLHSWVFLPAKKTGDKVPVVVMAHGLGCIKIFGIEKYAIDFAKAGYAVVAFDYRGFAHSTGTPRSLIAWHKHLEDWEVVLDYITANSGNEILEFVDPSRIALWGSSYSGGHVVAISGQSKHNIKAVVSQVPFVGDLITPLLPKDLESLRNTLMGTFVAIQDALRSLVNLPPLYVKVFGRPGETGILKRDDPVLDQWIESSDEYWNNETPGRSLLHMLTYNPSGYVNTDHDIPTLFIVLDGDTICPPKAIDDLAAKFPKFSKTLHRPGPHFDCYENQRPELTQRVLEFFGANI